MRSRRPKAIMYLPLLIGLIYGQNLSQPIQESNTNDYHAQSVQVRAHLTLEVVEWCDNGKPVVFLAGLGHTAHVFDEFAPRFCDAYHVLGITRRGFGVSSRPDKGYDLKTLAEDIKIVMDSLDIEKAVLVGHSVGGDEMTKFAHLFPEKVDGLIYLEAASDKLATRDSLAHYPDPESTLPEPTEKDLESVLAYREYYSRVNGVRLPATEFRAICEWEPDGRFKGWITPGWVYQAIIDSLEHPDYSGIPSPSLAIYGVSYPITELFIDYDERDSVTQSMMKTRYEAGKRLEKMSRDLFRRESRNGRVVETPGAGHSLYITHADQVETAMRKFLHELE